MNQIKDTRGNSDSAQLKCSKCGALSFTASPDGNLVCDRCHTVYAPLERVCPDCGTPYAPDDRRCVSCGTDLLHECLSCGALNPLAVLQCQACGQNIGVLGSLFDRVTGTRGDWLNQVRESAPAIKAQQEAASEAQLAEMWAVERRRREALARAQAERDRQQRFIFTALGIVVAIIIVGTLVAVVISLTRAPAPSPYPF
ncbi:MAG: zinc ribbon domain-containing protein [Anaerolineae bacterium]